MGLHLRRARRGPAEGSAPHGKRRANHGSFNSGGGARDDSIRCGSAQKTLSSSSSAAGVESCSSSFRTIYSDSRPSRPGIKLRSVRQASTVRLDTESPKSFVTSSAVERLSDAPTPLSAPSNSPIPPFKASSSSLQPTAAGDMPIDMRERATFSDKYISSFGARERSSSRLISLNSSASSLDADAPARFRSPLAEYVHQELEQIQRRGKPSNLLESDLYNQSRYADEEEDLEGVEKEEDLEGVEKEDDDRVKEHDADGEDLNLELSLEERELFICNSSTTIPPQPQDRFATLSTSGGGPRDYGRSAGPRERSESDVAGGWQTISELSSAPTQLLPATVKSEMTRRSSMGAGLYCSPVSSTKARPKLARPLTPLSVAPHKPPLQSSTVTAAPAPTQPPLSAFFDRRVELSRRRCMSNAALERRFERSPSDVANDEHAHGVAGGGGGGRRRRTRMRRMMASLHALFAREGRAGGTCAGRSGADAAAQLSGASHPSELLFHDGAHGRSKASSHSARDGNVGGDYPWRPGAFMDDVHASMHGGAKGHSASVSMAMDSHTMSSAAAAGGEALPQLACRRISDIGDALFALRDSHHAYCAPVQMHSPPVQAAPRTAAAKRPTSPPTAAPLHTPEPICSHAQHSSSGRLGPYGLWIGERRQRGTFPDIESPPRFVHGRAGAAATIGAEMGAISPSAPEATACIPTALPCARRRSVTLN